MVDYATMNKRTEELLAKVNLSHRKPTTNVGDLSISEKQMVEIAKAVAFNAKVIVDVYKRQGPRMSLRFLSPWCAVSFILTIWHAIPE